MTIILTIIKGMLIGIANIIPGVSGGTMAVSLGIYDKLIMSVTRIGKQWKTSLRFLFPLGTGVALGIILFSYTITVLLETYTFITTVAFIGLILGGVPTVYRDYKATIQTRTRIDLFKHMVAFSIFFVIIVSLSMLKEYDQVSSVIHVSTTTLMMMFIVGVIAAATMVIPGISGSLVLMIMGYYYGIINTLTHFMSSVLQLDAPGIVHGLILLVPFGVGVIIGGVLVSRLIDALFVYYPEWTYSSILGLIVASPIAIMINTNALEHLSTSSIVVTLAVGLVLFVGCFALTYTLGQVESSSEDII